MKKFFNIVDNKILFVGDTLECFVPVRYQNNDILTFDDIKVVTMGIFDIVVNNDKSVNRGLLLPAILEFEPSNITNYTDKNNVKYLVMHFVKNDTFISSTEYVQSDALAYIIFKEMVQLGHMPKFITYEHTPFLLYQVSKITGIDFKVNNAIIEIMFSHLFRDKKNLNTQYRLTNYSQQPEFIGLRNVIYGADNTTAKLAGSYMNDGLQSALVNEAEVSYEYEQLILS